MQYGKFDVVVADFPFIDRRSKSKVRPAVIISSNKYNQETGFIILAMITSAKHSKLWNDIVISNPKRMELQQFSI